ncbi:MAG: branched-chain amino acid ABC transporter substrate-binding protein [Candidatus Eremiobacteraeota bacterium]|nr:branched-chain amino acid ABC transporter substrate-binding protein [Candidatus Eremiobacteraeota bacterium]
MTACSNAPSSQGARTIKIGIDLPVSGADASTGIPTQNGAVLAIEDANARGVPGGFSFAVSALDDAVQGVHDPAQGAQNVKTLIADPSVLAILGPYNSNVAKAQIPLTNDAGIAQISPATTHTGLTQGDEARALRTTHPDVVAYFRVCTTNDHQGEEIAALARRLGYHRAFDIDDNETYGKGLADVFDRRFTAAGGSILGHEHLTRGQQDFKALLTKARSQRPDMVFFGGTTASGGGVLRKQMGDVGMARTPFFGGDGISDAQFIVDAGAVADGTYYTVAAADASKLPTARRFIAAYRRRWKSDVGPYSANAYAAAEVAVAAIEEAIRQAKGTMPERAAVLANVAATKGLDTPIGRIAFDRNGDTTNPILSAYEIQNGKPRFVTQLYYAR